MFLHEVDFRFDVGRLQHDVSILALLYIDNPKKKQPEELVLLCAGGRFNSSDFYLLLLLNI